MKARIVSRLVETIRMLIKRPRLETNATRRSLLARLEHWEDSQSWQEFFEKYWRLIYTVARQAGLGDQDAQDVVQDTILSVAKQIGKFNYDPEVCSFKGWLLTVTRRRIADQFRKLGREVLITAEDPTDTRATPQIERVPDPQGVNLEALWDQEWQFNLINTALERVKRKANPTEFQIFYLHVIKEQSASDVARALEVNRARVYIAKHRISNLLKKEIKYLESKAP
jgi:RNA polymerase sigma-70 factor (ECF subfamily)